MKKILIALSLAVLATFMVFSVNAAVLSPGLNNIAGEYSLTVNALKGESVVFESSQFCDAVGSDGFECIKITSLPAEKEGTLYFNDVEASVGQIVRYEDIEKLRFEPGADVTCSAFGFVYDSAYDMTCNVVFSQKNNDSPAAIESPTLEVYTSSQAKGQMRGCDPDGDSIRFEVVDYPEKGELLVDSKTGEFTYTAGDREAEDSFTFRVKDELGAYSAPCNFSLSIREEDGKYVFSDIDSSEEAVAASVMANKGLMDCRSVDGKTYFSPEKEVSRLEFLVGCMNVFGADNIPSAEDCGFDDDSDIPDKYKGYVYSATKLGIVGGIKENGECCFKPDEPITKAQAAVILNNIIGYEAEKVNSLDGVPQWAQDAVCAMYELGVYDLSGGEADALAVMTRLDSAQMLYKVNYLLNE